MFFNKGKKGQSTVEYIVLVTAVIGIMIAFLVSPASPFKQRINSSMGAVTAQANAMATRVSNASDAKFAISKVNTNVVLDNAISSMCPQGKTYHPELTTNQCQ